MQLHLTMCLMAGVETSTLSKTMVSKLITSQPQSIEFMSTILGQIQRKLLEWMLSREEKAIPPECVPQIT
jgi:hypothetical protein